jgi:nitrite reductase/ring-hydroxylating ferredoxin subunit
MTILCHIDSIPEGSAKSFEHDGKQMFAVKHHGEIFLYLNQCPHMGVNLNWQEDDFFNFDGSLLQCSMHGALFEIGTGTCIAGPCKRQALFPIPFQLLDQQIKITDPTES